MQKRAKVPGWAGLLFKFCALIGLFLIVASINTRDPLFAVGGVLLILVSAKVVYGR